jgi:hypothetical protein
LKIGLEGEVQKAMEVHERSEYITQVWQNYKTFLWALIIMPKFLKVRLS